MKIIYPPWTPKKAKQKDMLKRSEMGMFVWFGWNWMDGIDQLQFWSHTHLTAQLFLTASVLARHLPEVKEINI